MSIVLTPYDEFPVHQVAQPFSFVPSTDYNWDDGYWFGVFNPDEKIFLGMGARVNPNTDMFGGYVFINIAGIQTTLRFNRCWRDNFNLEIGPWKIEFLELLKTIRLTLSENDSGLTFDIIWEGTSPAFLEDQHVAVSRGRLTTEQRRYSQPGKCRGWIRFRERDWDVTPEKWSGSRDHSWGLYAERPPLAPVASLLPPKRAGSDPQRALRLWTCFRSDPWSGFFHLHETAEGVQTKMNDLFATPFAGHIFKGWDGAFVKLVSGRHEIEFIAGTRIMTRAAVYLEDSMGGKWCQIFEAATVPWVVDTIGYHPGSWKDGGNFFTYHGSEELAIEWDEFDFSVQPFDYKPYKVTGEASASNFGEGSSETGKLQGPEYLAKVTTHAPDGSVSHGAAQVELFIRGSYKPYGFS